MRQYDANGNQWNYSYNEGARRTTMTDNKGNQLKPTSPGYTSLGSSIEADILIELR